MKTRAKNTSLPSLSSMANSVAKQINTWSTGVTASVTTTTSEQNKEAFYQYWGEIMGCFQNCAREKVDWFQDGSEKQKAYGWGKRMHLTPLRDCALKLLIPARQIGMVDRPPHEAAQVRQFVTDDTRNQQLIGHGVLEYLSHFIQKNKAIINSQFLRDYGVSYPQIKGMFICLCASLNARESTEKNRHTHKTLFTQFFKAVCEKELHAEAKNFLDYTRDARTKKARAQEIAELTQRFPSIARLREKNQSVDAWVKEQSHSFSQIKGKEQLEEMRRYLLAHWYQKFAYLKKLDFSFAHEEKIERIDTLPSDVFLDDDNLSLSSSLSSHSYSSKHGEHHQKTPTGFEPIIEKLESKNSQPYTFEEKIFAKKCDVMQYPPSPSHTESTYVSSFHLEAHYVESEEEETASSPDNLIISTEKNREDGVRLGVEEAYDDPNPSEENTSSGLYQTCMDALKTLERFTFRRTQEKNSEIKSIDPENPGDPELADIYEEALEYESTVLKENPHKITDKRRKEVRETIRAFQSLKAYLQHEVGEYEKRYPTVYSQCEQAIQSDDLTVQEKKELARSYEQTQKNSEQWRDACVREEDDHRQENNKDNNRWWLSKHVSRTLKILGDLFSVLNRPRSLAYEIRTVAKMKTSKAAESNSTKNITEAQKARKEIEELQERKSSLLKKEMRL